MKLGLQPAAKVLHPREVRRHGPLPVLHDHLHGLVGGSGARTRNHAREFWRQSRARKPLAVRPTFPARLSERDFGDQNQQQDAKSFSPRGAVALIAPSRPAGFLFTHHESTLSFFLQGKSVLLTHRLSCTGTSNRIPVTH